jgi:endonuclease/exonuclease/phosphatase family metal-dependent hydrolase
MRLAGWARPARVGVVALLAVPLTVFAPSTAGARTTDGVEVMTQNLYLGSSLSPALEAPDLPAFLFGVATIYGNVIETDFPARAEAIADEISADRPDLVALQEVSKWTAQGGNVPSFDFLAILQAELVERGMDYDVAVTSNNFHMGPLPLVAPTCPVGAACSIEFLDRDVILVNAQADDLVVTNTLAPGRYRTQASVPTPVGTVSFDRGWVAIDARFDGDRFRFVNTHLEVEDFAAVQEAQAKELIAGPLRTLRPVILAGDLNSAADGSTTATYKLLIKSLFVDSWWINHRDPGYTCCQDQLLDNPASELGSRIDFVLARLALPTEAHRVGATPFQDPAPYWTSDHAAVVATIRLF